MQGGGLVRLGYFGTAWGGASGKVFHVWSLPELHPHLPLRGRAARHSHSGRTPEAETSRGQWQVGPQSPPQDAEGQRGEMEVVCPSQTCLRSPLGASK